MAVRTGRAILHSSLQRKEMAFGDMTVKLTGSCRLGPSESLAVVLT